MRKLWIALVPVVVLSLAGCGNKGNKLAEPASLTPEQVAADVKNQKEAAAAEAKRPLPKSPSGQAEDSERRRQGGK
jgi:predicted small lipoprotein YifL